ncbi:MAG: hypothetical protein J6R60_01665 [Clostridia bacterium]|nr:hypothetical protein [Clostridia bacterium]
MNNYTKNVHKKRAYLKKERLNDLNKAPAAFSALGGALCFFIFILFLFNSGSVARLSSLGASRVLYAVLPSTFPYLVLSSLICKSSLPHLIGKALLPLSKILKLPPSCLFIIVISFICGFPVPSLTANTLYENGEISKEQCERLTSFCSFCGPPFIFSVFGLRIMKDIRAGAVCFGVQCALAIIFALITSHGAKGEFSHSPPAHIKKSTDLPVGTLICDCISLAGSSMLKITSFVIFFSVLCGIIQKVILIIFPSTDPLVLSILTGIIEMSGAVTSLGDFDFGLKTKFILGCIYIYWSGLSVLFQVRSTLDQEISMKKYLLGRFFMMILGGFISYFIYFFLLG